MTKRPRRKFSPDQKKEIAAEARRRLKAGESLLAISKSLDIGDGSLRLWLHRFEATANNSIQPVRVVATPIVRQRIALATPDRFRFEGLDLEAAIRLWERLR